MSIERPLDWFRRLQCFVCERRFNQRCDRHLLVALVRSAHAHRRGACDAAAGDDGCAANGENGGLCFGDVPRTRADAPRSVSTSAAARASSPDTRQDY